MRTRHCMSISRRTQFAQIQSGTCYVCCTKSHTARPKCTCASVKYELKRARALARRCIRNGGAVPASNTKSNKYIFTHRVRAWAVMGGGLVGVGGVIMRYKTAASIHADNDDLVTVQHSIYGFAMGADTMDTMWRLPDTVNTPNPASSWTWTSCYYSDIIGRCSTDHTMGSTQCDAGRH